MPKEHLNPRELPNWAETFSQIVVVRTTAARLIWVSGQVAVDGLAQRLWVAGMVRWHRVVPAWSRIQIDMVRA